mgnify:CR=1 FL=1
MLSFYITLIIINFPITVPNNRISQKQFCDMSINRDLLTEAIADAKAVKETAIENAKLALEESFTPHLKSMLAAKLDEMDKEYEEDDVKAESENVDEVEVSEEVVNEKEEEKEVKEEKVDEIDLDEMLAELEANDTVEESKEEVSETEEVQESESDEISEADKDEDKKKMEESTEEVSEEDKVEEYGKKYEEDDVKTEAEEEEAEEESEEAGEESEEEEEIDLEDMSADDLKGFIEDVIKDMVESGELEGGDEMEAGDDLDMPMMEDETVEEVNEEDKDDKKKKVDESDEVVSEKKDDEDKKKMEEEITEKKDDEDKKKMEESDSEEVSKALEEIEVLKTELNEVNLLNAKLLYTNKIFRDKNLTEDKKVKVLKAFDKASSVKEAKVIYETLNDGLINKSVDIKGIKGSASKATGTAPVAKKPIVESDAMVERFKKLAGII